jgi:hypothetical protein
MQKGSIEYLYAAAEDAVSQAHAWDARQLIFRLTSAVGVQSCNPLLYGLPVTDQDIFGVGADPVFR